ncbi:hypothetical protein AU467_25330 [Mesorhizobium loti]|uniref:Uncharacterized protein n=1 Tax=Rhizobium loti TaxID=381 RepID=A0A117N398_RHILI|nr:hypothetical protein AU467_25330 [Mesorhizobium loti]
MMAVFFAITGGIVVFAAYLSKRNFQKEMKEQRDEEAAFKEEVAKFRAKKIAALEAQGTSAITANNDPLLHYKLRHRPNIFIIYGDKIPRASAQPRRTRFKAAQAKRKR